MKPEGDSQRTAPWGQAAEAAESVKISLAARHLTIPEGDIGGGRTVIPEG